MTTESEKEQLETFSLQIAAAILCSVPGSSFSHVDASREIDGRFALILRYPPHEAEVVQQVLRAFRERRLQVDLHGYSRHVNRLRDAIKSVEPNQARSERSSHAAV